jgi:hypothetical protein
VTDNYQPRHYGLTKAGTMTTDTPRMRLVMTGGTCAGFLISLGPRGVEALDRDGKSLGAFASATEAAAAVEKSAAPACPSCGERP